MIASRYRDWVSPHRVPLGCAQHRADEDQAKSQRPVIRGEDAARASLEKRKGAAAQLSTGRQERHGQAEARDHDEHRHRQMPRDARIRKEREDAGGACFWYGFQHCANAWFT